MTTIDERGLFLLKAFEQERSLEEIARSLGVTVSTVKSNVRKLYDALDARTRAQAVAEAIRRGLL